MGEVRFRRVVVPVFAEERVPECVMETADIFLENQPTDTTESLGLDYESLKSRFPRLILTSITPFGRTGPYRDYKGYDLTANAIGGMSFGAGYPHRE